MVKHMITRFNCHNCKSESLELRMISIFFLFQSRDPTESSPSLSTKKDSLLYLNAVQDLIRCFSLCRIMKCRN